MTSYIEDEFETLVGYSRVRVCCYTRDGKLMRPFQPRDQQVNMYQWGGDHLPKISIGDDDRVWLMFRRPDVEMKVFRNYQRLIPVAAWKNYTRFFDEEIWSQVISFNDNHSRIDSDFNAIALGNGNLLGIWHADNRVKGDNFYAPKEPQQDLIYSNVIDSPGTFNRGNILAPTLPGISHYQRAGAGKEKEDIKAVRNYTVDYKGKCLKVFRGDLHRHTDVSTDGASDGMVLDLYRYAMDAAGLDFVANTDHNQKTGKDIEYVQWRQEKIADLFYIPGRFVTFYGYERSIGYPNGHRNIIHIKRGVSTVKHPGNIKNADNDTERLYVFLEETDGICIPHTTGLAQHAPNTWEAEYNSCIEPVVEIYQGTRMSSEYTGAPLSGNYAGYLRDSTSKDNVGVVWDAWEKGHKIGVIASSDHQSTHCAFANVYAENLSDYLFHELLRQLKG